MIFYFLNVSVSTNHLRSCCVSFLLLAFVFTTVNFLTTTTTIHKSTTTNLLFQTNSTFASPLKRSVQPEFLLSLDENDVHKHRFYCYRTSSISPTPSMKFDPNRVVYLHQPNKSQSENESIPYHYELWKSSPLMPRIVTECEHHLMIQLLTRFDKLTRKYSLDYMMIDGTLLGSWRHHDLIPWDDDIDIMMSVNLKDRLNQIIQLETSATPYHIEFYQRWDGPKEFEYYKFYFSVSPRFSEHPWRYPFVDLIFYHENQTHVWQENLQNSTSVLKKHVFPLEYRPFGPLWLPSPRSPRDYFQSIGWKNVDDQCFNGPDRKSVV